MSQEEEQATVKHQGSQGPTKHFRYGYGAGMSARVIVGIVLIFFGLDLLIELATGVDVRTVAAGLGSGFLLYWRTNRRYPWLVAGSILLGVGLGNMFSTLIMPVWSESLERLFLAGGFALIPLVDKRSRSGWAWIPAGILGLLAVASFAVDLDKLFIPEAAAPILPALAIIAGSLLLLRGKMSSAAFGTSIALIVAIAVAIASVSGLSGVGDIFTTHPSYSETRRFEIPDLEGRRLVVRSRSGSIELSTGISEGSAILSARDQRESTAKARLSRSQVEVSESSDLVTVSVEGTNVFADFEISVPEGSSVRLESGSGRINARVKNLDEVRIFTGSGDVRLTGYPDELVVRTGSGDVRIFDAEASGDNDADLLTGSGDVAIEVTDLMALEIDTGSGDIEIDGDDVGSSRPYSREGTQGVVNIRTGSGDVDVTGSAAR